MEINNGSWKVYIHTNKVNGKMYIGITSTSLKKRFGDHGSGYSKHNIKFWRAIQKYGWNQFEHEIFADHLTKEEANHMEELLIEKLDTIRNGYNCRGGGQAGRLSEETKEKIKRQRAKQMITREQIEKTAAKNRGIKRSEEFKQNLKKKKKIFMKQVYCNEMDETFESITAAAKALGITKSFVSQVCNGIVSSAHGYHLRFV